MDIKKCRVCGIELTNDNWSLFQKRNHNSICKPCRRIEQRKRRGEERSVNTIVEHHIKYKDIHGVDETLFLTESEHRKLHYELRKNGRCNIPPNELRKISGRAVSRTEKSRRYNCDYNKGIKHKTFNMRIDMNIYLNLAIGYNTHNNNILISSSFYGNNKNKLKYIEEL